MPPAHHRSKRPNTNSQPPITSFFPARAAHPADAATTTFPEQPAHIQRDLLNVGMRVRKAVGEGYQTTTSSSSSCCAAAAAPIPIYDDAPRAAPRPLPAPRLRELTPFCGLHKVGGFAQQFTSSRADYPSVPFVGSQESEVSLASIGPGKRRFDDDLDDDDDDDDDEEARNEAGATRDIFSPAPGPGAAASILSPRSRPTQLRAMAVPRSRRKMGWAEQENRGGDFEDAPFLELGGAEDVDMEEL